MSISRGAKLDDRSGPSRSIELKHDADCKIHQRALHGVHLKMRPRTLLKWPIGGGGGQALAVAFDLGQHGAKIEYDTWVRTGKTMVYFSSICLASSIRMIQDRFQILVSATVVPPDRKSTRLNSSH